MNPRKVLSVFRREFKSYFDSPVAYVFLVAFLVLLGFLTFGLSNFYERGQAVLTPFFIWHPWVYLLLVPAATMGLWAEERRNGTIELLLTMFPGNQQLVIWCEKEKKRIGARCLIHEGLLLELRELLGEENVVLK